MSNMKKFLRYVGVIMVLCAAFFAIGTAGSIDREVITLSQGITQFVAEAIVLVLGVVVVKVCGEE